MEDFFLLEKEFLESWSCLSICKKAIDIYLFLSLSFQEIIVNVYVSYSSIN